MLWSSSPTMNGSPPSRDQLDEALLREVQVLVLVDEHVRIARAVRVAAGPAAPREASPPASAGPRNRAAAACGTRARRRRNRRTQACMSSRSRSTSSSVASRPTRRAASSGTSSCFRRSSIWSAGDTRSSGRSSPVRTGSPSFHISSRARIQRSAPARIRKPGGTPTRRPSARSQPSAIEWKVPTAGAGLADRGPRCAGASPPPPGR